MTATDHITSNIIRAAISIHSHFGPGLLESVYLPCLAHELVAAGYLVEVSKPVGLEHQGLVLPRAYVLDLLVEGRVIVEVKCVAGIAPIHVAQLLTYLRLMRLQVGLILNFNVTRLTDGIKRVANEYVDAGGRRL